MQFPTPLVPGTLLRRYKRFLADIVLDTGEEITAHCANPGSMMGLKDEGLRVWVQDVADPKRKLRYSWKLVELPGGAWVGIDTGLTNKVVQEALTAQAIPALSCYTTVRPEVRYAQNSRVDFLLSAPDHPDCYVEVKNVTLSREPGLAEFPDSVTARGAKHMNDLASMVAEGHRAVILYLVQRTDCTAFQLAENIDPKYAQAASDAFARGVEHMCFDTILTPQEVTLNQVRPVIHRPSP